MSKESTILIGTMNKYNVTFEELAAYLKMNINKVRSLIFSDMDFSKFNKLYYKILETDANKSELKCTPNTEDQQIAKYYNVFKATMVM